MSVQENINKKHINECKILVEKSDIYTLKEVYNLLGQYNIHTVMVMCLGFPSQVTDGLDELTEDIINRYDFLTENKTRE